MTVVRTGLACLALMAFFLGFADAGSGQPKPGLSEETMSALERVVTTARSLKDEERRSTSLAGLAAAQMKAGLGTESSATFEEALEIARSIKSERSRNSALAHIAGALALAGRTADGLKLAASVDDAPGALGTIAVIEAKAGRTAEAAKLGRAIKQDFTRALVLSNIANVAADLGFAKEALTIADEALQAQLAVPQLPSSFGNAQGAGDLLRHVVLAQIVAAQAKAGKIGEALQTAAIVKQQDVSLLSEIAKAQAKAGLLKESIATFAGNLGIAHRIADHDARARSLASIALAQAQAGDFRAALETVDAVQTRDARSMAYIDIAVIRAGSGHPGDAAIAFARVLQSAKADRPGFFRIRLLMRIAAGQAKAGLVAESKSTMGEAVLEAQALDVDTRGRALVDGFSDIVAAQSRAGSRDEAAVTARQALQCMGGIKDEKDFFRALVALGWALVS